MKLTACYRAAAFALFLMWCGASSVHAQGSIVQPRENAPYTPGQGGDPRIYSTPMPTRPYDTPPARLSAVKSSGEAVKMGDTLRQAGPLNYQRAFSWYTYALKLDAKDARAHYGLGELYRAFNDHDKAEKAYEQALALKPQMVEAHIGLGREYSAQKLYDKAIQSFQQALTLMPKSLEAQLAIGDCYFVQKKYTEAVAAYQKTIELKSKSLEAHYNLGMTYLLMNNRAAAVEQGRIVRSIDKVAGANFESVIKRFDAQHN